MLDDVERLMSEASSFTCPDCGAESFNPNDIREGYCGRCHWWTGDQLLNTLRKEAGMPGARQMRTFPIDQMTSPEGKSMVQLYKDYWWPVSQNGELYFYGTQSSPYLSPQCNANQTIAERVSKSGLCEQVKEIRQIPLVFVPVNVNDYI